MAQLKENSTRQSNAKEKKTKTKPNKKNYVHKSNNKENLCVQLGQWPIVVVLSPAGDKTPHSPYLKSYFLQVTWQRIDTVRRKLTPPQAKQHTHPADCRKHFKMLLLNKKQLIRNQSRVYFFSAPSFLEQCETHSESEKIRLGGTVRGSLWC